MGGKLEWVEGGGITTPQGWRAGATYAGVRTYGEEPRYDVGLLASERPCAVAGIFSRNAVVGAPIKYNRPRVLSGVAQAIVAVRLLVPPERRPALGEHQHVRQHHLRDRR